MTTVTAKEIAKTFGDIEEVYTGEPLPRGKYFLEVIEAAKKYSKSDNFPYVEVKLTVVDGEYVGRKMTERLFLRTEKPDGSPSQALGMTRSTLKLMHGGTLPDEIMACSAYDSEALADAIVNTSKGLQFEANVIVEKDKSEDGAFGDKNRLQPKRAR